MDHGSGEADLPATCQRLFEFNGLGQFIVGHHFFHGAHHKVHQGTFGQAEHVAHRAHHNVLDLRVGDAFLQRDGKVLNDHDGFGASVFELVLQLAWGVKRIDIDHHQTCTQDGGHSHRILRHIGHHDRHSVTFLQAQRLKVRSEGLALGICFLVRNILPHEAVGRSISVLRETLLHQANQ